MLHPRLLVIGLDCVPPAFAFERYRRSMPHLSGLMERGLFGPLRSCFPPITLPAWACMVSGRDPGELGIYGFRRRSFGDYGLSLNDAGAVDVPRVWDLLGDAGWHVSALAVPPSYPPARVRGEQLGCFLTPDADAAHCFPRALKGELAARFGPYIPDVAHVGAQPDAALLERLEAMTRQHFAMARHVWQAREPDFLMFVTIGPDRFHHAFYRQLDPAHPQYAPRADLGDVGARYYGLLDREIGALLEHVDDDTCVLVASDHGARPLEGAFRINNWLQRQGYLALRETPPPHASVVPHVDWTRTRAWAEGGYYARVFLNVQGREPQGVVAPEDYEATRQRLRDELAAVSGPGPRPWDNRVEAPETLYAAQRDAPPDLLAVFDDLRVRPVASLGDGGLYASGDDRGNDACNHDWDGIVVLAGPGVPARGAVAGAEIYDVGATLLALANVAPPPGFRGRDLRRLP